MAKFQVFLDSDVIISSLLSQTGASYLLIDNPNVVKKVSKTVQAEVKEVIRRLNLNGQKAKAIFKNIKTVSLSLTKKEILKEHGNFVFDENDTHVVAGADRTGAKFLIAYNLRHYKVDKIKAELGILVLKPGNFLQYLRSQNR